MAIAPDISLAGLISTPYDSVKQPPPLGLLEAAVQEVTSNDILPITSDKFSIILAVDSAGLNPDLMGISNDVYWVPGAKENIVAAEQAAYNALIEVIELHPIITEDMGLSPTIVTTDGDGVHHFSHPEASFTHASKEISTKGTVSYIKFTYELPPDTPAGTKILFMPWVPSYDQFMEQLWAEYTFRIAPDTVYIPYDFRGAYPKFMSLYQYAVLVNLFNFTEIVDDTGTYHTAALSGIRGLIGAIVADIQVFKSDSPFGVSKSSYTTFDGLKEN